MIDEQGYRANVGIIVCNDAQQVIWAQRANQPDAWQFPQGGIHAGESFEEALYRELDEELGLQPTNVAILGETQDWLHYDLPEKYIRRHKQPLCIGQKQHWFLLQLTADTSAIQLDRHTIQEFSDWRWVTYDYPPVHVIDFKQAVYRTAMDELHKFLP